MGPAATSILALAEEAGVTRLTVYRHFPDDAELFAACSQHWAASQQLPSSTEWSKVRDPEQRMRLGLHDLYRFYQAGEPMLTNVRRDRSALPTEIQQRTATTEALYLATLLKPFRVRGVRRTRLRAVLGHAVSFWTWRSLVVEQGLSNSEATDAMTALALAMAEQKNRPRYDMPAER